MKQLIPFEYYLKIVREFNEKYPGSHVGGSIGLFLHGFDLKRELRKSDLDITIPTPLPPSFQIENYEESSAFEDFDIQLRVYPEKNGLYIKVDINVNAEIGFDVIRFEGNQYNVSKKEDILSWKKKYAQKGIEKHINDLITIETGLRPAEKPVLNHDDLPF